MDFQLIVHPALQGALYSAPLYLSASLFFLATSFLTSFSLRLRSFLRFSTPAPRLGPTTLVNCTANVEPPAEAEGATFRLFFFFLRREDREDLRRAP